jgi:hypothetical protein
LAVVESAIAVAEEDGYISVIAGIGIAVAKHGEIGSIVGIEIAWD